MSRNESMQVCRVFPSPATTTRTSVSIGVARCRTGFLVDSDHGRTLANVAHGEPPSQKRVSVLLERTVSLLPRTLSDADSARGPDSSLFWSNVLKGSITELRSGSTKVPLKATVAVCGFDKCASSHDLVTALLEDPFTSDSIYSNLLRDRWKSVPSYISIEYGKPTASAGKLSSPSGWLQRFPHAIQLIEFPDLSSVSSTVDETDRLLLSSDVLLLLCDLVVTPLSDLVIRAKHLLDRPNTILTLTSGSMSDTHRQFVSRTLLNMGCQPGHILFVDPKQALNAVTALQGHPSSPSTIDRYQRDTLGSRISTITVATNEVLSPRNPSETPLLDLRRETALSQVHGSLSASFLSVETAEKEIERIAGEIGNISLGAQSIRENIKRDIFGNPGDNRIETALSLGRREMNKLLCSLSFWKIIWRVDEIGALVSAAVRGRWCKELEHQLILQTGCLEINQRQLSSSASSLLSDSPFHSPVLENQLQQLIHSPARNLTPSSLTRPIYDRRDQLIQHTSAKLHREAQSVVVGAFGGVLGGAGLGWWLVFGEHILSLGVGTEMGTAIGSGALLAMGSIRWAVGKWERAKRRWVQDLDRVGEGLTRDLQSTVQRTLEDNVTNVASTACKGMQDLVDRRRNEISQLHRELCDLDAELQACAQSWARPSPPSIRN